MLPKLNDSHLKAMWSSFKRNFFQLGTRNMLTKSKADSSRTSTIWIKSISKKLPHGDFIFGPCKLHFIANRKTCATTWKGLGPLRVNTLLPKLSIERWTVSCFTTPLWYFSYSLLFYSNLTYHSLVHQFCFIKWML